MGNPSTFTFSTSDCLISPIYNEFKFIKDIIAIANRDHPRVWNINYGSDMEKSLKAIEKTEEFFNSVGISTHLKDYGDNIDLEFTVKEIISRFKSRNIKSLGENGIVSLEDIEFILRDCF
ncbi:MAG: hypothetical protein IPH57_00885 [Saprospiraceae bacterium]|nr:hypothetical protein [Saprospiraceae bacterium]